MVKYLRHSEIDKAKWDACIVGGGHGLLYAMSWYLDIVHPGWEALVDDDYAAVMPLTGKEKFGVCYLHQPFFTQQLGVFGNDADAASFLQHIPSRYRFVEIRLNERNRLADDREGVESHSNFLLSLGDPYGEIKKRYHTNTRRNLVKAEGNGLRVVKDAGMKDVVALFRRNRGASLSKWGDEEYARLLRLAEEAVRRGNAFVYGVAEAGSDEIVCGALFLKSEGRITFLFSGCGEKGKSLQAMTFLIDSVIREYSERDMLFDFEGSDDANLARFYQGFGGTMTPYPGYKAMRLSLVGRFLLSCWKKLRQ